MATAEQIKALIKSSPQSASSKPKGSYHGSGRLPHSSNSVAFSQRGATVPNARSAALGVWPIVLAARLTPRPPHPLAKDAVVANEVLSWLPIYLDGEFSLGWTF